jgi:hypothetical protein
MFSALRKNEWIYCSEAIQHILILLFLSNTGVYMQHGKRAEVYMCLAQGLLYFAVQKANAQNHRIISELGSTSLRH